PGQHLEGKSRSSAFFGLDRERSPAGCGRPEAVKSLRPDARNGDHCRVRSVIAEAAQCDNSRPRGHGSRIVMAAFGLIPRIAFLAVVARTSVLDALDSFANHSRVKHQRGGGVLKSRPGL